MAICQKCLDNFYYFRKWVLNCIAYLSLRLYGIEDRTFEEVKQRSSNKASYHDLELSESSDIDTLLSLAKDLYKTANDRRNLVADKSQKLQTLSAFLLTISGIFLPKAFDFEAMWMRVIFFVAFVFLLNSIILMLVHLAVGGEPVVAASNENARMTGDVLKRWLVNQYGRCAVAIDNRTDYLVDIYRAAHFFFLSAFTVVVILISINYFNCVHPDRPDAEKIVQQLRSDPHLIDLLRGPKGEPGSQGKKGDPGITGQKGDKGDQGDKAVVDVDDVVKRVINDARTQKVIHDANQPSGGQSTVTGKQKP